MFIRFSVNHVWIPNLTCDQLKRKIKLFSLSPFVPENLVSRYTGSAVPSCVSPLIFLHKQAEFGALFSSAPLSEMVFICSVNRHRVRTEFVRSLNCVPIRFNAESPLAVFFNV